MTKAEHLTASNQRLILSLAVSYGGRQDITMAARALAQDVAAGRLKPEQIDEDLLGQHMALADLPPPDMFIRTSGVILNSVTSCCGRSPIPSCGSPT